VTTRNVTRIGLFLALGAVVAAGRRPVEPAAPVAPRFREPEARFSIRVGTLDVRLRVLAISVMPGSTVHVARGDHASERLRASADGGRLAGSARRGWTWTAPDAPGFHGLSVVDPALADTIHLTFMVLRPASEVRDNTLNGYRIGTYRPRPASMSAAYEPPGGFVEARPEHWNIPVSPNFRLGQFLCKQDGDPRYLLVTPRLLMKLEALLVAVNEAGYATPSLTVMSGYRTPAYNRAIGNTTDFSRHLWGDAADVFVDVDGDEQMDDLNGDGRSDVRDARWLAAVVERMMDAETPGLAPGGLSTYRRNAAHGPFVHLDTRGRRARW
jgi:hypothetical protein